MKPNSIHMTRFKGIKTFVFGATQSVLFNIQYIWPDLRGLRLICNKLHISGLFNSIHMTRFKGIKTKSVNFLRLLTNSIHMTRFKGIKTSFLTVPFFILLYIQYIWPDLRGLRPSLIYHLEFFQTLFNTYDPI